MGRMSHAQFQYWQIVRLGTVPNGKFPEVEFKKGQYWKWVPVLEMGMPVPVLANCAFGHLRRYSKVEYSIARMSTTDRVTDGSRLHAVRTQREFASATMARHLERGTHLLPLRACPQLLPFHTSHDVVQQASVTDRIGVVLLPPTPPAVNRHRAFRRSVVALDDERAALPSSNTR